LGTTPGCRPAAPEPRRYGGVLHLRQSRHSALVCSLVSPRRGASSKLGRAESSATTRGQEALNEMSYQDQQLTCAECGRTFTDTADDQAFRAERGYTNAPRRCPECRAARRAGGGGYGGGYGGGGGGRAMYDVVCAACGKETQVPFQPRGDRPVYCSDCYSRQGGGRGGYGGDGDYGGGGRGRGGYGRGGGGRY
jgi:CxxC-x17-CxxC domain-containing protein